MDIFASSANYSPFCPRKCGCAECIIAKNTIEAKSFENCQYGYGHIHQDDLVSGWYTRDLQHQDRFAKYQAKMSDGDGVTRWPRKQTFTSLTERGPDLTQARIGRDIIAELHEPLKVVDRGQKVTALGINNLSSCSWLQTEKTVKGNETEANCSGCDWPWSGNWNTFQLQREPSLNNTHPSNSVKELQDSRFRNVHNSDSIYHGRHNFVPAKTLGTSAGEGCMRPAEQTSTRDCGFQHSTIQPTLWNYTPVSQCNFVTNSSNNNQELRTIDTSIAKPDDKEWQLSTWQTQRQTPPRGFTSLCITDTFFKGTDSNNSQNDQSMLPLEKTGNSSEEVIGSSFTTTVSQQPVTSPPKGRLPSQPSSDQNKYSGGTTYSESKAGELNSNLQNGKPQELMIDPKEFEDYQETKITETYDRGERIRNLKALLKKQEKALDILKHKMKPTVVVGKQRGNINNIPFKEDRSQNIHTQGDIADLEDFPPTDDVVNLGKSLKRRWLENWNEDDAIGQIFTNDKKRKEGDLLGSTYEEEDQDLTSAECTAVEGLVRLSKD